MIRYQRLLLVFVMLLASAMLPAAGLRAADDVLNIIPENALGFVVVRNASRTNVKIADLAGKLEVQAPDVLALVRSKTGLASGVNFDGDVALAFVPQGDDEITPVPVLVLPVTDYDVFVKSLNGVTAKDGTCEMMLAGKPCVAIRKGSFAVMTRSSHRTILPAIAANSTGVGSQMASIAPWTRQTDAYVVGMPGGIAIAQKRILAGLAATKKQIRLQWEQQGQPGQQVDMTVKVIERSMSSCWVRRTKRSA